MLARLPAKMHYCVHPLGDTQRVLHVGNVCAHKGFAGLALFDWLDIREAQLILARKFRAQNGAYAAGSAGDEDGFHRASPRSTNTAFMSA